MAKDVNQLEKITRCFRAYMIELKTVSDEETLFIQIAVADIDDFINDNQAQPYLREITERFIQIHKLHKDLKPTEIISLIDLEKIKKAKAERDKKISSTIIDL